MKFVFFGTSRFAVIVLETLHSLGFTPALVVTTPDKKQGKKLLVTPPPAKVWALENNVPFLQPEKLDAKFKEELELFLASHGTQFFLVASYGKIIPQSIFDLPEKKTLNIHPSLLPKLRGATPIEGAILGEEKTGVTIIQIDTEMDHGPILAQKEVTTETWPLRNDLLEEILAKDGAKLLASVIPQYMSGKIKLEAQDHSKATYTKKVTKEDGEINLSDDAFENWKKIQAYYGWPGSFFFITKGDKKIRIKITKAKFENGKLEILKVIPEGKKEINFESLVI